MDINIGEPLKLLESKENHELISPTNSTHFKKRNSSIFDYNLQIAKDSTAYHPITYIDISNMDLQSYKLNKYYLMLHYRDGINEKIRCNLVISSTFN